MDNNKQISLTSALPSLSTINTFDELDRIVERLASSKTYNNNFLIKVADKDGKMVEEVDKASIANVLLLGNEFGFKPIESILLFRKLSTADAVVKIHKGRDLGLSPMAALQNIYIWNSGSAKETIYTSIHVIYKCLHDAGVIKTVIEDGTKPILDYTTIDGTPITYDPSKHVMINTGIPAKDIETLLKAGHMPVKRIIYYKAQVELKRGSEIISIPYTSQQAIDAGLYRGTNSFGEKVDGKDNWNNHLAAHLVKMSVMNGARMIIGDKLQGSLYIADELPMRQVEDLGSAEVVE